MNSKFTYLFSLLLVFVLPSIIAGYSVIGSIPLLQLMWFVALITIVGSIWDIWAAKHGINDSHWLWDFNPKDTLGLRFLDLPIEEYLFYPASSIYVIFMWESIGLSLNSGNPLFYLLVGLLGVWTLLSILIYRSIAAKK